MTANSLPYAYSNLAVSLHEAGDPLKAVSYFNAALEIADLPEIRNNLGLALMSLGRVREAETHFEAALKSNPDFQAARENLRAARAK